MGRDALQRPGKHCQRADTPAPGANAVGTPQCPVILLRRMDEWALGVVIIDNEDHRWRLEDQMADPNFGNSFNRPGAITDQASFDVGLRAHMVRVYNYMASGLALSGIVAFGLFSSAWSWPACSSKSRPAASSGLNVLFWAGSRFFCAARPSDGDFVPRRSAELRGCACGLLGSPRH